MTLYWGGANRLLVNAKLQAWGLHYELILSQELVISQNSALIHYGIPNLYAGIPIQKSGFTYEYNSAFLTIRLVCLNQKIW